MTNKIGPAYNAKKGLAVGGSIVGSADIIDDWHKLAQWENRNQGHVRGKLPRNVPDIHQITYPQSLQRARHNNYQRLSQEMTNLGVNIEPGAPSYKMDQQKKQNAQHSDAKGWNQKIAELGNDVAEHSAKRSSNFKEQDFARKHGGFVVPKSDRTSD